MWLFGLTRIAVVSLVLATLCNAAPFNGSEEENLYDVIIVGGGASGLAALQSLVKNGVDNVLLLEAQDCLGGRIRSVAAGDELLEIGAEWIHGDSRNPLYRIAVELNELAPRPADSDWDFRLVRNDGTVDLNDTETFLEITSFRKDGLDNRVLKPYYGKGYGEFYKDKYSKYNLDESVRPAWLHFLEEMINNDEGTQDWEDADAYDADQYASYGADNKWKNGYATFIDYLVKDISEEHIRISTPVEKIFWYNAENASVVTSERNFTAKKVLIATSIGYLKKNHEQIFEPSLPAELFDLYQYINLGAPNKIFIGWEKAWWGSRYLDAYILWTKPNLTEDTAWLKGIVPIFSQSNHPDTLLTFVSDKYTNLMQKFNNEELQGHLVEFLREVFPDADIPDPILFRKTEWNKNPWICGSYSSFISVKGYENGIRGRSQFRIPITNAESYKVLFWAGEYTHDRRSGTVDGAYESGLRAAQEIIYDLSIEHKQN